jgi:hypothetical protein
MGIQKGNNMKENTVKKTPTDFMLDEVQELITVYNKTQFPLIDYVREPEEYIRQKRTMAFDILCDRLGKDNSYEYSQLLDENIKKMKSEKVHPHEIGKRLTEIGQFVIDDLKDVTPQILIERSLHTFCNKYRITTAEQFANAIRARVIEGADFYIYIRRFAIAFLNIKEDEYLIYCQNNMSGWRAMKGETLPKNKIAYIWSESIELSKRKTGTCYTDTLFEKLKFTFL